MRLGFTAVLLSSLLACNKGSQVEQLTFTSSLQGVMDLPAQEPESPAPTPFSLPASAAYLDGAIAIQAGDTLYARGYQLVFADAGATGFTPYYPDQKIRDSLSEKTQNYYSAGLLVEGYLKTLNPPYFSATDTSITLLLADGRLLELARWERNTDEGEDTSYAVEHYFPETGFFLLRAQFSEGNCWLLVHRQSGRKTYISGLPHFSPDGSKMITRNLDLEAGYSFNGLGYYTLLQDSLALTWELEINNWGPSNIRWLSDTSLLIEKSYWVGTQQHQWKQAPIQLMISPPATQAITAINH
jgi:hypothetical protein